MGWIIHEINDASSVSALDEFLSSNLPSKVSRDSGVDWISVSNDKLRGDPPEVDYEGLFKEWDEIHSDKNKIIDYWLICDLAKKYNMTTGKWLFYALSGDEVDTAWKKVAKGIAEGELGTTVISAKVSPYEKPDIPKMIGQHVICVYNEDFTNKEQVYLSENLLRKAGIKYQLMYKPDIFTHCNIYAKNPYGLRPTIYHSKFDNVTYQSNVTAIYSETRPPNNPITNYFKRIEK